MVISYQPSVHLGHTIGINNVEASIDVGIKDVFYRTNDVMAKFGFCTSDVRSYLFNTYCTSFYGCPLWKLDGKHIERFFVAWRKCIRKIWNVPPNTHGYLLEHLCHKQNINVQLLSRFLSFYHKVVNSNNSYVSLCAELCIHSNTNAAGNVRSLFSKLNIDPKTFKQCTLNVLKRRLLRQFCSQ